MATATEPQSDADVHSSAGAVKATNGAARADGISSAIPVPSSNIPAAADMSERAEWATMLPQDSWHGLTKCCLDRVLALVILLVMSPLILIAMALVKATSRGPALYLQTRVGRFGRLFTIYKIRSMVVESESLTGACWSTPGDQRVTRVGIWLRRTHIDELPQLWNVITGDMSLVGPRPERPEFVPMLERAIPRYRDRLLVRPGITGFAQVQLPPDTDINSVRTKLAYDLHYVQAMGFWFDFRICWATAFKMGGASFALLGRLFRFPDRRMIESRYQRLAAEEQRIRLAPTKTAKRIEGVKPIPLWP